MNLENVDDLDKLLRRFAQFEQARADALTVPSRIQRTEQCPPLPAVAASVTDHDALTPAQREHVATCEYCRAALEKVRAERSGVPTVPSTLVTRPVWGARAPEEELSAGKADLLQAVPLGGSEPVQELPAARTVVLALTDNRTNDPPGLALSPEQIAHYFTDPEVTHIALDLIATEREGGWWAPAVRVLPGPDRQPMTVTVVFSNGPAREFVLLPSAPGVLREMVSEPADDVPAAAIEIPPDGWHGAVSLS
jgi:hypothetical protein